MYYFFIIIFYKKVLPGSENPKKDVDPMTKCFNTNNSEGMLVSQAQPIEELIGLSWKVTVDGHTDGF